MNTKWHVVISGVSRGLGSHLYEQLQLRKYLTLTAIGRNKPDLMRECDYYLESNLLFENIWEFDIPECAAAIIFISNAGTIDPIETVTNQRLDDLRDSHMVNFYSPFQISSSLAKLSLSRETPFYIFNISSGAATKAIAGWSAYCSSKAAIRIGLDCLAEENNLVSVIHMDPGVMETDMQQKIRESADVKMKDRQKFINYKNQGFLKSPLAVATEILETVDEVVNENSNTI